MSFRGDSSDSYFSLDSIALDPITDRPKTVSSLSLLGQKTSSSTIEGRIHYSSVMKDFPESIFSASISGIFMFRHRDGRKPRQHAPRSDLGRLEMFLHNDVLGRLSSAWQPSSSFVERPRETSEKAGPTGTLPRAKRRSNRSQSQHRRSGQQPQRNTAVSFLFCFVFFGDSELGGRGESWRPQFSPPLSPERSSGPKTRSLS